MHNAIRVAVIGCGRIAGHHCRSIATVPGVSLAAVCDLVEAKARAYGDEFSVPVYTDFRMMLRNHPDVSLVVIATPSGMHFEHAAELIERWGKHVVVEKPTFMRLSQLRSAYQLARERDLHVFPVFQNRYNKAVRRVRQAIEAGELGDIRIVSIRTRWCRPQRYYDLAPWRGTFSHDGGALTNQGIHHIDLLRHLGGPVSRVNATMRTLGADIEVEDTVVATFQFEGSAVGNLEVTTAARPDDFEASLSIVGSKGLAQIGGIAVNELQIFTPDPSACETYSEDFSGSVYGFGHQALYNDIAGQFAGGAPYPISDRECAGTLALLHAFYRSDEKGDWVDVGTDLESDRLGRPDDAVSQLYRTPE